jgi:hypothetical protein
MNSLLDSRTRPTVLFNVANPEHRRIAWVFLKNRSWKDSPVLFALPEGETTVATLISREMAVFYSDREFSVLDSPQNKLRAVL